ncbi:MAG: hypothetical protein ACTHQM_24755 [Thermoanaerobaculia bacterium]
MNLVRKNDRTATLPQVSTNESTPFAIRPVTLNREMDVYDGTIRVTSRTYGEWTLKAETFEAVA